MSGHIITPTESARSHAGGELLFTIHRIVWQGDDGGPCILRDRADKCVKCQVGAGELEPGKTYRFLGNYAEDPKYGRQFVASAYLPDPGSDRRGVIRYLTGICTGVGDALAGKLYDASGSAAVRHLRECADEIEDAGIWPAGLALSASRELQAGARNEQATIDLFGLFSGRGLGAVAIRACLSRWGERAARLVSRNPWLLLRAEIPGASFKRVHKLYLERGGDPKHLKVQAMAGWQALSEVSNGSTWHPLGMFNRGIVENVGGQGANFEDALYLAVRSRLVEIEKHFDPSRWLADPAAASAERNVALCVSRLLAGGPSLWPQLTTPDVTQHQADAVNEAARSRLFLLTGTPGTGKTFTAAQLLKVMLSQYGDAGVRVAAPTGKAAVRIQESMARAGVKIEATTIHRLLEVSRNGRDGKGWGFQRDANNPLDVRFLAIDEFSMCDTALAASLFAAVRPSTHVLIIGDPYQLPPVGHGAPLRDLIAAGVPRAHLSEIKRNSGLITTGCLAVKEGRAPRFADKFDLDAGDNLRLIESGDDVSQVRALASYLTALRAKPGVDVVWDCQILTPTNDSSRVSRKPLNDYLQLLLNPAQTTDPKAGQDSLRLRDKVICLRNQWYQAQRCHTAGSAHVAENWVDSEGTLMEPAQVFVANGELGQVVSTSTEKTDVIIRLQAPLRYVRYKAGQRVKKEDGSEAARENEFALAYAITGHKSQGSEWPYVVVMVDPAGDRVASREWLYTAISRASKACLVIGSAAVLARQWRRAELPDRKTFLKELLIESMATPMAAPTAAPPIKASVDSGLLIRACQARARLRAGAHFRRWLGRVKRKRSKV